MRGSEECTVGEGLLTRPHDRIYMFGLVAGEWRGSEECTVGEGLLTRPHDRIYRVFGLVAGQLITAASRYLSLCTFSLTGDCGCR